MRPDKLPFQVTHGDRDPWEVEYETRLRMRSIVPAVSQRGATMRRVAELFAFGSEWLTTSIVAHATRLNRDVALSCLRKLERDGVIARRVAGGNVREWACIRLWLEDRDVPMPRVVVSHGPKRISHRSESPPRASGHDADTANRRLTQLVAAVDLGIVRIAPNWWVGKPHQVADCLCLPCRYWARDNAKKIDAAMQLVSNSYAVSKSETGAFVVAFRGEKIEMRLVARGDRRCMKCESCYPQWIYMGAGKSAGEWLEMCGICLRQSAAGFSDSHP